MLVRRIEACRRGAQVMEAPAGGEELRRPRGAGAQCPMEESRHNVKHGGAASLIDDSADGLAG